MTAFPAGADPNWLPTGWPARVAEDGTFVVNRVPAGDYKILLTDNGDPSKTQYWWEGHGDYSSARLVTVADGGVAGIDFSIPGTATMSGQVGMAGGSKLDPNARITVSATRAGSTPSRYDPAAPVDANGRYVLKGLKAGMYTLNFADEAGVYLPESLSQSVFIGGSNVTAPNFELTSAGQISGSLIELGGKPILPTSDMWVLLYGKTGTAEKWAKVENGKWTFAGVPPGRYAYSYFEYTSSLYKVDELNRLLGPARDLNLSRGVAPTLNIAQSQILREGSPKLPVSLKAVAGDGKATITWPAGYEPPEVDSYTITAYPSGRSVTVSVLASDATIPGLVNGRTYRFTIVAKNSSGQSRPSPVSNAVIPLKKQAVKGKVAKSIKQGKSLKLPTYTASGQRISWSTSKTAKITFGRMIAKKNGTITLVGRVKAKGAWAPMKVTYKIRVE